VYGLEHNDWGLWSSARSYLTSTLVLLLASSLSIFFTLHHFSADFIIFVFLTLTVCHSPSVFYSSLSTCLFHNPFHLLDFQCYSLCRLSDLFQSYCHKCDQMQHLVVMTGLHGIDRLQVAQNSLAMAVCQTQSFVSATIISFTRCQFASGSLTSWQSSPTRCDPPAAQPSCSPAFLSHLIHDYLPACRLWSSDCLHHD